MSSTTIAYDVIGEYGGTRNAEPDRIWIGTFLFEQPKLVTGAELAWIRYRAASKQHKCLGYSFDELACRLRGTFPIARRVFLDAG